MLNNIVLMGRFVRDPEVRTTQFGGTMASFTLAVDRDIKDKDGKRATDFIDVVTFSKTAEFVGKNFTKGRMALLEGRLQSRDWTDKHGNKRKSFEVNAHSVYFGDSKPAEGSNSIPSAPDTSTFEELKNDEELPF